MMLLIVMTLVVKLSQAQIGNSSVTENLIEDSCSVLLPSAFSPNNDGLNDQFRILCNCDLDQTILEVYNRWGDLVFQSSDRTYGWDGTINGNRQPVGSYIWVVNYRRYQNNEVIENTKQGTIALLR